MVFSSPVTEQRQGDWYQQFQELCPYLWHVFLHLSLGMLLMLGSFHLANSCDGEAKETSSACSHTLRLDNHGTTVRTQQVKAQVIIVYTNMYLRVFIIYIYICRFIFFSSAFWGSPRHSSLNSNQLLLRLVVRHHFLRGINPLPHMYMYMYIYKYVNIYLYIYLYMCVSLSISVYIYIYYIYIYIWLCMYVCMYVCMHACMHACVYIYIYINTLHTVYIYIDNILKLI